MQFVNSKWAVFAYWVVAGIVIAAYKAGILPPELLALAGGSFTLPIALGPKK